MLDLGKIEILSLHRCERLTTAGIATLARSAFFSIKLKRLNLGYNKYIHDGALVALTRCEELTTLNLEYTDVSEAKALLLQSKYRRRRRPSIVRHPCYPALSNTVLLCMFASVL